MASAFTEQEKTVIRSALKNAARNYASTIGMRKTTVDQLAESAGISKGAFYRFYDTKEHLFFEILEEWHTEVYEAAWKVWESNSQLCNSHRLASTIMEVFRMVEEHSMMNFLENDIPYLLRKIPREEVTNHYHSDEVNIYALLKRCGVQLKESPEIFAETMRGLFFTFCYRKEIGEEFHKVLKLLVQGACDQLVL